VSLSKTTLVMLANYLCRLGVVTRIVDKASTKVMRGWVPSNCGAEAFSSILSYEIHRHADGFQCRTLEVFHSLGLANRTVSEGNEIAGKPPRHRLPSNNHHPDL
jgi:hypothetical protein